MNPQQLSDLLVGIAQAQATLFTAIERTLEKSPISAVRQAAQQAIHSTLTAGTQAAEITFENLASKLLEGALAPGSYAERELKNTALENVIRLLGQAP